MKPPNGKGNRNGAKMTLIRLPLWTHIGTHIEDILERNNVSEIGRKHILTMHSIKDNCYTKRQSDNKMQENNNGGAIEKIKERNTNASFREGQNRSKVP